MAELSINFTMSALFYSSGISGVIIFLLTCSILCFQSLLFIVLFYKARMAERERIRIHQELFGLMKRMEGLSAGRRALISYQFDNILESLTKQLPTRIAADAGERIFNTESLILKTLSEIQPSVQGDTQMSNRLEQVVHSMENLEQTVISLTCESVRQALVDARQSLLSAEGSEAAYR